MRPMPPSATAVDPSQARPGGDPGRRPYHQPDPDGRQVHQDRGVGDAGQGDRPMHRDDIRGEGEAGGDDQPGRRPARSHRHRHRSDGRRDGQEGDAGQGDPPENAVTSGDAGLSRTNSGAKPSATAPITRRTTAWVWTTIWICAERPPTAAVRRDIKVSMRNSPVRATEPIEGSAAAGGGGTPPPALPSGSPVGRRPDIRRRAPPPWRPPGRGSAAARPSPGHAGPPAPSRCRRRPGHGTSGACRRFPPVPPGA